MWKEFDNGLEASDIAEVVQDLKEQRYLLGNSV